jgi:hypothetical protein
LGPLASYRSVTLGPSATVLRNERPDRVTDHKASNKGKAQQQTNAKRIHCSQDFVLGVLSAALSGFIGRIEGEAQMFHHARVS